MATKQLITNYQTEIQNIVNKHLQQIYDDNLTRFSYIDGAQDFIDMINDCHYQGFRQELLMIKTIAKFIKLKIPQLKTLIDLGTGDGIKSHLLMKYLVVQPKYLGLDISPRMLEIAKFNLLNYNSEQNNYFVNCNWKNPEIIKLLLDGYNINNTCLYLLLGNTLANEINMVKFLEKLHQTANKLAPNNYLLIGIELFKNDASTLVREYNSLANHRLTVKPLKIIGMDTTEGKLNIIFNNYLKRIEEWYCLSNDKKILLSSTYKPTLNDLNFVIIKSGWKIIRVESENNFALILVEASNN